MKTKIALLLVMILSQNFVYSQNKTSTRGTEKYLQKQFSKIPPSKYADLVPYFENSKWGYIDRTTSKVLVPAIFESENAQFFTPHIGTYCKNNWIEVDSSGVITVKQSRYGVEMSDMGEAVSSCDRKVASSKNGFKGFTVNGKGELLSYSDLYEYNKQGIPGFNIQLFKYKNQYYGIVANLKNEYGIIDSLGNPVKGFEFNYNEILLNRNTKDSVNAWFFVRKNSDSYSLINMSLEMRCENEIFTYPLLSTELFGVTALHKNEMSGIFDRYNLKWIVKPQVKIVIDELYYSSKRTLNTSNQVQRNEANMYYLVIEKNRKYFVDFNGNSYIHNNK